jgi:hypothetical protein
MLASILISLPEADMFHRTKGIFTAKAAVVALSAVSSMALAHTYERCDADGDHCVRVSCDHDGDKCWRESEYSKNTIYGGSGRWVCDSDGDRCHYEYADRKGNHHREHHDEDDRDRDR